MTHKRKWKIQSNSALQTMQIGCDFAVFVKPGDIVCLFGDLGSGKTTFVKGLAQGLSVPARKVHSPSFTIMNIYEGPLPVYHLDLYRLDHVQNIVGLGYEEFLYGEGLAVVEWPDRLGPLMPREYIRFEFNHLQTEKRLIGLSFHGQKYQALAQKMDESDIFP